MSWQSLFYTVLGCCFISFRCSNSQDKSSPSKLYSHGTSRPKSPPQLTGFPFMTTFPQLVCLFITLVNQVAFNLAIYWLLGKFKGNLCTAATLYITVTWPFPKGDRYIQVWLNLCWDRSDSYEDIYINFIYISSCSTWVLLGLKSGPTDFFRVLFWHFLAVTVCHHWHILVTRLSGLIFYYLKPIRNLAFAALMIPMLISSRS